MHAAGRGSLFGSVTPAWFLPDRRCCLHDVTHIQLDQFDEYRSTLDDDRRHLLEMFHVIDIARKVVGVGSVGTRAFIVLLQGRDDQDPLFLQVKEASKSVLEDHLPKSRYRNSGERVVRGQRMMQAASDTFLGWTKRRSSQAIFVLAATAGHEGLRRDGRHVRVRAGVLRRGVRLDPGSRHARSGDPVAIATYLGVSDTFDASIDFPVGTRTRTRSTTRPSWTRSAAAGSPPSKESDHLRAAHHSGLILHMAAAARWAAEHVACACPRVRTARRYGGGPVGG